MGENKTPWPGRSPRWQKQHCGMVMAQKQATGIKKSSKQATGIQIKNLVSKMLTICSLS